MNEKSEIQYKQIPLKLMRIILPSSLYIEDVRK